MSKKKDKKFDDEEVRHQVKASLDEFGREITDPNPRVQAIRQPESQRDRIRRIVREEVSAAADDQGFETFEESQDFEIEDPWDASHLGESSYELLDDEYPYGLGAPEVQEPVGDDPPAPDLTPSDDDLEHPDPEPDTE